MRRTVFCFFILLLAGCTKEGRWPSDVKPGNTVEVLTGTGGSGAVGKVIAVEGEWLTLEHAGKPVQVPREKVLAIRRLD